MAQEQDSDDKVVPAKAELSFLRKNDLLRTLKRVDKEVDKAIAFLSSVVEDESQDVKVRISAAQFIVDKKVQISSEISRDSLTRTVAEIKRLGGMQQIKTKTIQQNDEEDEAEAKPYLNFKDVIDVNKISD